MAENIHLPKKEWTLVADSNAELHVKIPKFTKIFYTDNSDDPATDYPTPSEADLVKVMTSSPYHQGYYDVTFTKTDKNLYIYPCHADVYVYKN